MRRHAVGVADELRIPTSATRQAPEASSAQSEDDFAVESDQFEDEAGVEAEAEAEAGAPTAAPERGAGRQSSQAPGPAPAARPASRALTGSVASVVDRFRSQRVPVTALIDGLLELHGDQYLSSWQWSRPAWPDDAVIQPVDRWTEELLAIVDAPTVFGRLAILGWSLLDDRVAAAAQASGMLAGIARGITPTAREFLRPEGLRLLRRRAPWVALTIDELPPAQELLGVEGAGAVGPIAVAPPPPGAADAIGHWAVAYGGQVHVGKGASSRRAFPEQAEDSVKALGWSTDQRLHVMSAFAGLILVAPDTLDLEVRPEWGRLSRAMVSRDGIATTPDAGPGLLHWGAPDGDPVPLPELGNPSGALVAVAGDRVAALCDGWLWFGGPGKEWSEQPFFDRTTTVVTATDDHVVLGNEKGEVQLIPWEESARKAWRPVSLRVLDGPITQVAGSSRMAVVASDQELAVVSGAGLIGRWTLHAEGWGLDESEHPAPRVERIHGVALSHDGAIVAVAGYPLGLRFWRVDVSPEVRLTSYSADTPEGEDHLGILPTVDALAAIVVARAVQPPLSVGLFGAWGSGKSFFMRRLEERVAELSREAHDSGRAQAALWAWRNVRQVRFNAWHYAAADVWAGLLEQLVSQLARPAGARVTPLTLPLELENLQKTRIQLLAGELERAEKTQTDLNTAAHNLADAQTKVQKVAHEVIVAQASARADAAKRPREVLARATVDELDKALTSAGLPKLGGSLEQTLDDIRQARRSVIAAAVRAKRPDRRRLGLALVLLLVAGVVVAWTLERLDVDLAGLFGLLASVLAAVAGGARWLSTTADEVKNRLDDAETKALEVQADLQEKLEKSREDVLTKVNTLGQAREERDEARRAVADAETRLRTQTPGGLLAEYLEGRSEADDYRSMLGLIGTVRRDLQVISDAVELNNGELSRDPARQPDEALNRVVLYIDDLDRCPPTVVVKVLESLSMLLTFPLFVVVVAVDAHWISKSLATVYPEMLTDGDVTPDNYLEKIFQIPVWLDRPSDLAASSMARALLQASEMPGAAKEGLRTVHVDDAPAPARPAIAGRRPESEPAEGRPRPRDIALGTTPPAPVLLDLSEIAEIAELAPLVSRTPRALKRYLNTYRILKALVDTSDLGSVRLLLGIATGRPDIGERLLGDIASAPADRTLDELVRQWPESDRTWLSHSIPPSLSGWTTTECGALQPVAHQVHRFVFHTEHSDESHVAVGRSRRAPSAQRRSPGTASPRPRRRSSR